MKALLLLTLPLAVSACQPKASVATSPFPATAPAIAAPAARAQVPAKPTRLRDTPGSRAAAAFPEFLSHFLQTAVSGTNFDSLVHHRVAPLMEVVHPAHGLTRFASIGIYCKPLPYAAFEGRLGTTLPDLGDLPIFYSHELPQDGYCDEASSPDGIYFAPATDLPQDVDVETGLSVPLPDRLTQLPRMEVVVLYEKWYLKDLFFVQEKGRWYLVVVDDCECGA